jgi:hypothetical protein
LPDFNDKLEKYDIIGYANRRTVSYELNGGLVRINITDEALRELNKIDIKNIRIIYHGQGCGGPVLSMAAGLPDMEEDAIILNDFNFFLKKELIDKYKTVDIDYSNTDGFSVDADNSGGCIRCNGCWLNTIYTNLEP